MKPKVLLVACMMSLHVQGMLRLPPMSMKLPIRRLLTLKIFESGSQNTYPFTHTPGSS